MYSEVFLFKGTECGRRKWRFILNTAAEEADSEILHLRKTDRHTQRERNWPGQIVRERMTDRERNGNGNSS